jgi:uncharacterized membrane protein YhaH (DUF805 family)
MDMVFCHGCAKQIHKTAPACPGCGAPQPTSLGVSAGPSSSGSKNWYFEVLKKYVAFNGRARRKEFWYFTLFSAIISVTLSAISGAVFSYDLLGSVYSLAVLLPGIAVAGRRLHDTGRSAWWMLLPIVNIVFFAQDGNAGTNKFGADPKTE